MFGTSDEMHVEHLQNNAINFVDAVCSVISQPVAIILRPWYGTRCVPIAVTFFSVAMMMALPLLLAAISLLGGIIPFLHIGTAPGMFDIGSLAKLYFALSAFHAFRLWKRMIHMESELHSEFEGPALPFFQILPKGNSFWFVRIVYEPALVLIAAIVLQDLFIFQPSLGFFLRFAALALFVKNWIAWRRGWETIRIVIDGRNAAPLISKLIDNTATDEDLAPIGYASFPKNIAPEIRQAAAQHIARSFTAEN
jgi:hypothetical protein